ncbi:MAG: membrane protein insertase YidC [Oscillospiraceae bacterium]|nr:membrane protein insertase YidC [Oscillospiraceae bacterium]
MLAIFNPIAVPFGWLLMTLYNLVNDYALSLILIAILVRVLLLPVQMKAKRGQLRNSRLQPKMAEIRKKHGANKQKLNEETAKLYKDEGINPASGCLWGIIQMPIMIALFYAIRAPLTLMMGVAEDLFAEDGIIIQTLQNAGIDPTRYSPEYIGDFLNDFYAQVYITQDVSRNWSLFENLGIENLQNISFYLGPMNLADIPNWQFLWSTDWSVMDIWLPGLLLFLLPLASGGVQFAAAAVMRKTNPMGTPEMPGGAGGSMGTIMKLMPLMSVFIGFILPAALALYWMIGGALQLVQDVVLTKKYTKILDAEDAVKAAERKEKEAVLEAKRIEAERRKAEGLAADNKNKSKRKKKKGEKQDQREKAAEWEKKTAPMKKDRDEEFSPSREGNRRYARGRAYDPERYANEGFESDELDDEVFDGEVLDSDFESEDMPDVTEVDEDFEDDEDYEEDYDDEYHEDDEYDDDDDQDTVKFETKRF